MADQRPPPPGGRLQTGVPLAGQRASWPSSNTQMPHQTSITGGGGVEEPQREKAHAHLKHRAPDSFAHGTGRPFATGRVVSPTIRVPTDTRSRRKKAQFPHSPPSHAHLGGQRLLCCLLLCPREAPLGPLGRLLGHCRGGLGVHCSATTTVTACSYLCGSVHPNHAKGKADCSPHTNLSPTPCPIATDMRRYMFAHEAVALRAGRAPSRPPGPISM